MYSWLVVLHLLGLVVFLACHGVAMFVAFRIRQEEDRTIIAALLGLASRGNQMMYIGLLLAPWVIASYVVVVVTLLAMWAMGSGFYYPLREGLTGTEKTPRLDDAELRAKLTGSRRPEALAGVGLTALVLLIWLMTIKPG